MVTDDFAPDVIQNNTLTAEEVARTVTFVLSMPKTAEVGYVGLAY